MQNTKTKEQPISHLDWGKNPLEVMPIRPNQPWRVRVLVLVLALGLGVLWLEYARLSLGLPFVAQQKEEIRRGRVLLRSEQGFVTLAESTGKAGNLKRHYPQGRLAAGVVGFLGKDKGLEGIEQFEEERLARGQDLVLTLDPALQASAEAALENAMLSSGAESGTVVVLGTGTNKLLAVANAPSFDLANWNQAPKSAWINRAFRDTFDPGSTIKALVAAMLVQEGIASPDTPIYAEMLRPFRNAPPVRDSIKHSPNLNLSEVLRYSSNVGISRFADQLGPQKLHEYLVKFGFGQKTWKNDPSLERNKLSDWQTWQPRDFAAHAFGQGFTSTALQLATAFSVIANDGKLITPILYEGQDVPPPTRVISPQAAKATRKMLEYTVNQGIKLAQVPNYCVAGKTGTSETWQNGVKSASRFHALFAGMFPAQDPKVTIVVQLYAPKNQIHGSLVAAPVFRQIVLETAARYSIAPKSCGK